MGSTTGLTLCGSVHSTAAYAYSLFSHSRDHVHILAGASSHHPNHYGGWNEFSDTRIFAITEDGSGRCFENKSACIHFFRKFITTFSAFSSLFRPSLKLFSFKGFYYLGPVIFVCALSITIMIASYFAERSNRKSFIQRKLLKVGADAFSQHNTTEHATLPLTDLLPFLSLTLTGSHKAEGRRAGEAEGGKR